MITVPYEKIKEVLTLECLFEPIKQVFIDYESPKLIGIPVNLLHFPNGGDTHIKIAALGGYEYFSIKVVSMFPENKKMGISPYSGSIFLFDGKTGFPVATLNDKGLITDLRTAAAGTVISDFVAPPKSKNVGVIGTGTQAYLQIMALSKLRTIDKLMIYGRNEDHAAALKLKFKESNPSLNIELANSTEKLVKESEIIVTTTPSREPLIKGEWLRKGQHITAVGADDIYKNEMDQNCFECADAIYLDSISLNKKYGEYSHAIRNNPNLAAKTTPFGIAFKNGMNHKETTPQITVSKLVGLGIQDLVASIEVMRGVK